MFKARKGFTLIELLVVIAIIGILSSVVLASLNSARQKSRDARRISDIKQLQLALELYFDDEGAYPAGSDATGLDLLAAGGQIATIPLDPSTGNSYEYAGLGANCTDYHIGTQLEDPDHSALTGDADATADDAAAAACSVGATDFAGGGAGANGDDATTPIYDVTP